MGDNGASNGVVHIINGVLLPPQAAVVVFSVAALKTPVPGGKATIATTKAKNFYDCSGEVLSSFQVDQDQCYGLANVSTSVVNFDQTVHCLDNGDFEVTDYKSSDGSCTGKS